jgi:hypothetical protein
VLMISPLQVRRASMTSPLRRPVYRKVSAAMHAGRAAHACDDEVDVGALDELAGEVARLARVLLGERIPVGAVPGVQGGDDLLGGVCKARESCARANAPCSRSCVRRSTLASGAPARQ